ncbi:MAG TPA: PA domain-containing protein, partial [Planctomycetota bacterium]|nr:PA domain-containing protein [Planctomycetota bacterium]
MNRIQLALTLGAVLGGGAVAAVAAPHETTPAEAARAAAAATITQARCHAHVDFLASDLLEGRATPSRGLGIAAEYIASHYARLGLEPGGDDGTFFQAWPVLREVALASSALACGDRAFKYGEDYIPLPMSGSGAAEGQLVFAGYGITAPEEKYDDYAGIDAAGKVVLVLRHEPREKVDGPAFRGRRTTRHAFFQTKIENAVKHGAKAILIVTDPNNHEAKETAPEGRWPNQGMGHGMGIPGLDDEDGDSIPSAHISVAAAAALLGKDLDLAATQKEIDEKLEPRSRALAARVKLAVEVKREYD